MGFNEKNVPGHTIKTPGMAQDMRRLVSPDANKEGMKFGFKIGAGDGLLLVSSISSYEWGEGKKGIVYVFDLETLEHKFSIKNYDPYNTDFGYSLAAGHGLIAVGHGTSNRYGHVYLYDHSGNLVIRLEAPTNKWRTYDDFGYSVKFTPEYLVVGANRSSSRSSDHGVVYYFKISDIKSGLYRSSVTSSSYGNLEPGSNGVVPTDTSKSVFPTSKVGYWGPHSRSNSYGWRAHYGYGYLFNAAPTYDYDMDGGYNSDCGGLWAYDLGQWDRDERPSSTVDADAASYSERETSTDGHYSFFALDATDDGDGQFGWNLEIDDNIMVINAPRYGQGATSAVGMTFIFKLAPGSGDGDITSDATISEVLAGGDSTNISGMTLDPYPQIGALLHSANSRPSTISPTLPTLTPAHSPASSTFETILAPKYDNNTTLYKDNDSSQDIGLTAPRSSSWLNYVASTKLPDGASYVEMTFTGLTRFMAGVSNGNDLRFSYTGSTTPITGMDGRVGRYEISQGTSSVYEITSGANIVENGTVIGFLMNKDNNTITFYIDGTLAYIANMDLSSADCVFGFSCVNTDAATANFGATPFAYQPNLLVENLPALAQGDGVVDAITSSVTFTVGSSEQKSIIFNTRSTKQTSTNSAGATTFEVTGGTPMSVDKSTDDIGYLDWGSFSGSGPTYSTYHDKYMRFAFNPGTYTITLTSQSSQEILVPYMIFDEPYGKVNSPDAIYDGYLTSPGRIKLIDDAQHKAIADGPVGETWVQISTQFTEKIGDILNCGNGVLIATGKEAGPLPDHTSYHKLVNTQSRKLYRSDDYGSTWTVSDPALPFEVQNPSKTNQGQLRMATGYHACEHLGNGVILVGVGSDGVDDQVGEFSPYLLRSTDYGLTWTKHDPLLDDSRAAGYGDRHTHDSTVRSNYSSGENQFAFRCIRNLGNGVAIASTGHELYENTTKYYSSAWRTTDYGSTWSYIDYAFGGVITFISNKLSNDAIYACVTKYTTSASFDVYKSTDDGSTWTAVSAFKTTGSKTNINDVYSRTCVWSIEELSDGSVLVGFGGRELEIGAASSHYMMSTVVSFPSLNDMESLTDGTEGKWNHENGNQYKPLGAQGAYGIDLCQATDIPGLVFASTYAQSYDGQGDAMIFKSSNYGLTWRNIDDLSYDFNTSGYHKPAYIGNGRLVVGGSGGGRKVVGYSNNKQSSSQMYAQSGKMGKIYISDVSLVPTVTATAPVETDPRSVVIDLGEGNLVKTGDNLILEFSAPVSEANGMEGRMSFYDKDGIEIKAGPHSDATTEIFIKNSVGGTIVDYDPKFMAMDNSGALYRPRPDETVSTSNKNYPYHKAGNQTNLGTFSKNTGTLITGLSDPKHVVDGNLVTYHEQTLPVGGAEDQGINNNEYWYESQSAMTWIEFGTPIPVTSDNISLWMANPSIGDDPGTHNGQFNLYIEYSDGTDYTAFLEIVSSPVETFRHVPAKYDVTDSGATGKSISKISLFNASTMYFGQLRLFGIQFGDNLVGTPTSAEPDSSYGPVILNDHVMRLEIEKTLRGVRYIKMPVISAQSIRRISNRIM